MKTFGQLFLLFLVTTTLSLHLHQHNNHFLLTSVSLQAQTTAAIQNLSQLNSSLDLTLAGLNPFNQQQRLSSLESAINNARKQLFAMYFGSMVPLTSLSYYCQSLTPAQITSITTATNKIQSQVNNMGTVPPFSNSLHPYQQTSAQMTTVLTTINGLLTQTGTATAGAPVAIQQNNLAGGTNWALGGATPTSVASSYNVGTFQNGNTCPLATPYLNSLNQCFNCTTGTYYDLNTKSCTPCANFNTVTQVCVSAVVPPVVPPNSTVPPANSTVAPVNPAAPVNNTVAPVPPPPPPVVPTQYITNTAVPSGLLLPTNTSLPSYQAGQPVGPNVKPCPSATPYFDGTSCIACGPGQLFDVAISTCLTCPTGTVYSNSTYHCMPIQYYTNITLNNQWISVNRNFTQLQTTMNTAAALPNAQPCPSSTPFYNGTQCIACGGTTPYYSFDTNSCQACGTATTFSSTIHQCVIVQQRITSLSSPNLILGGLPFNEWRYYYVNNQTANPQLANCPTANPYFDGKTCINCVAPAPYFSLMHRVCVNCAAGTTYSPTVRECLSSSGNIVTQNPTLVKMAAGIFA